MCMNILTHHRIMGFRKIKIESINLQATETSIFHFTTDHNFPSFTGPCRASTLKNLQCKNVRVDIEKKKNPRNCLLSTIAIKSAKFVKARNSARPFPYPTLDWGWVWGGGRISWSMTGHKICNLVRFWGHHHPKPHHQPYPTLRY